MTNPDVSEADVDESTSKKCRKCEQVKPLDDFYVRNGKYQARCKKCLGEQTAAYRRAHPEVGRRTAQNWRDKNPEAAKAGFKRWYEANKVNNRDRVNAWRRDNPEEWAAAQARFREQEGRAAEAAERARQWRIDHPDQLRQHGMIRRARIAGAAVGEVDLAALWEKQSGICALCGHQLDRAVAYPDPRSPSVDHIIPIIRGGSHAQENLQYTCLVCNLRKGSRLPE